MALNRRTLLLGAGAGLAAWACSTRPARFATPTLETGARVRDVRVHDGTWWACGSVLGDDGVHSPRLWRGAAPEQLAPVTLAPISFYGERSELYSIGVGALGLVAIGAQSGGFHAMPRSASWVLDGDVLREVDATAELFGGPSSLALVQACAGSQFVLIGSRVDRRTGRSGACVWTSPDGTAFTILDDVPGLRAEEGEQSEALGVAAGPDGSFVAAGDGFATSGTDTTTHALAWTASDPSAWDRASVPADPHGGRTSMTCVAAGPSGLLAGGTLSRNGATTLCVWSCVDGTAWSMAPIGGLATAVTNTVSAVTALTHDGASWWLGGRLGTTPVLATSRDLRAWYRRSLPPTAPASAQVRVAVDGRLLVAISDLDHAATYTWPA
ncbi:MAG: hypothetical protein QM733_18235 [Ilumatobacteraceae bacterium]